MRKLTLFAAAAAVAAIAGVSAPAAHAAGYTGPCTPSTGSHSATTTLTNRLDSGGNGDWAIDGDTAASPAYGVTRTFKITLVSQSAGHWTWNGAACDGGQATAIPGAFTPNQGPGHTGQVIRSQVTTTLNGTASYTFTTDAPLSAARNLGLPASENGTPAPGSPQTTSLWYEQAFPAGTTFGGPGIGPWSWTYTAGLFPPESWTDASANNGGQVPSAGNIS